MEGRYGTRKMWTYLTVHLSQDSSKTRAQPSVSCTSYDVGSGRKLGSLELYELPCSGNHATVEGNPVN